VQLEFKQKKTVEHWSVQFHAVLSISIIVKKSTKTTDRETEIS